jgi:hypothetical protein
MLALVTFDGKENFHQSDVPSWVMFTPGHVVEPNDPDGKTFQ